MLKIQAAVDPLFLIALHPQPTNGHSASGLMAAVAEVLWIPCRDSPQPDKELRNV